MATLTIASFLVAFHPLYWQFENRGNRVDVLSGEQTPLAFSGLPKFYLKKALSFNVTVLVPS